MSTALLDIRNVTKAFGGLRAVDNVSLSVGRHTVTGLIGPNGSGKTTLFNIISGVHKPDSGEILFDGRHIDGLSPHDIYAKGLVRSFQIPRLFCRLTVLDNMLLAARGHTGERFVNLFLKRREWLRREVELAEKALRILELLELDGLRDSLAGELSGGQMKLLEIGRSLMADPQMLLLDEPATGVHPALAHKIFERIVGLRDELRITFFIIEHRIEILLKYVDWVYVMNRGRVVTEGDPERITDDRILIDIYMGEG
ncbi:TPA: ABC transporter ATP-binding protein [Candidatus Bathyarchaeota archaeon]|nr:ABC transporter ATP-binding protein [Candidatus Bathyarchaeota archaeon]